MTADAQFLKSALSKAPELVPSDGQWSVLMQVDGLSLFHEEASLAIDPSVLAKGEPSDVFGNTQSVPGVFETRYPATGILGWKGPAALQDLLASLRTRPFEWRVSLGEGFPGSVEASFHQTSEDGSKGQEFILVRGPGGTEQEIDESSVEIIERSESEDQVGFQVRVIRHPSLVWQTGRRRESQRLGVDAPWECELLLRLSAACGEPCPDNLQVTFRLEMHQLASIKAAAAACIVRIAADLVSPARSLRTSDSHERACTYFLRLHEIAGSPEPALTLSILRRRQELREDLGRDQEALSDAGLCFQLAHERGLHGLATEAAISAYHLDRQARREEWARRACKSAESDGNAEDLSLAEELLGDALREAGQAAAAIDAYGRSLDALKSWPEAPQNRTARIRRERAKCWMLLNDLPKSAEDERYCLECFADAGDWADATRCAWRLAEACDRIGDQEGRRAWSLRAISLAERSANQVDLAESHAKAAEHFDGAELSEESLRHSLSAIDIYSAMEDRPNRKLAILHERVATSDAAIDESQRRVHDERAVSHYDLADCPGDAVDSLIRLAEAAMEEDRGADALRLALDASRRSQGGLSRLQAATTLGWIQSRLEAHSDALATFETNRSLAQKARGTFPRVSLRFHRSHAASQRAAGKLPEAEWAELECLDCCKRARDWEEATDSALRLADDAVERGDVESALKCHERAIRLARQSSDPGLESFAIEVHGDRLRRSGNPTEALRQYRKAMKTLEDSEVATPDRVGRILREMMRCERDLTRTAAAMRLGETAVERLLVAKSWTDAAAVTDDLASIALSQRDPLSREKWHRQTVELAGKTGCPGDLALAYEWIGDTLKKHDRPIDAIPSYLESLRILESWPESTPSRIARVHGELARCHAKLGDFTAARESALLALKGHADSEEPKEAVDLVESLDPAFLADPTARAVKAEAIRLAKDSNDEEMIRRMQTLHNT